MANPLNDITNKRQVTKKTSSMASVFDSSEESTPYKIAPMRAPQIVGGNFSTPSVIQTHREKSQTESVVDDIKHKVLGIQRSFQRAGTTKEKNNLLSRFNDVVVDIFKLPSSAQAKLLPIILRLHETELIVAACDQISQVAANMKSNFTDTASLLLNPNIGLFRLCQDGTRFKRFSKQKQPIKPVECIKSLLSHVHVPNITSSMITMAQVHPQWESQILYFLRHLFNHTEHAAEIEANSGGSVIEFMAKMLSSQSPECRKEAKRLFRVVHKKMPVLAQELLTEVDPTYLPKTPSGPTFEDASNVKLNAVYQKLYKNSKKNKKHGANKRRNIVPTRSMKMLEDLDTSSSMDTSVCVSEETNKENISMNDCYSVPCDLSMISDNLDGQTNRQTVPGDDDLVQLFTPKPDMTQMSRLSEFAAKENSPDKSSHVSPFERDGLASPRPLPEEETNFTTAKPNNPRASGIGPYPSFSPQSQISAITAQLAQVNAILSGLQTQPRPEFASEPVDIPTPASTEPVATSETASERTKTPAHADEKMFLVTPIPNTRKATPVPKDFDTRSRAMTARNFQNFLEDYDSITSGMETIPETPTPTACNLLTLLEGSSGDTSGQTTPSESLDLVSEVITPQEPGASVSRGSSVLSLLWTVILSVVITSLVTTLMILGLQPFGEVETASTMSADTSPASLIPDFMSVGLPAEVVVTTQILVEEESEISVEFEAGTIEEEVFFSREELSREIPFESESESVEQCGSESVEERNPEIKEIINHEDNSGGVATHSEIAKEDLVEDEPLPEMSHEKYENNTIDKSDIVAVEVQESFQTQQSESVEILVSETITVPEKETVSVYSNEEPAEERITESTIVQGDSIVRHLEDTAEENTPVTIEAESMESPAEIVEIPAPAVFEENEVTLPAADTQPLPTESSNVVEFEFQQRPVAVEPVEKMVEEVDSDISKEYEWIESNIRSMSEMKSRGVPAEQRSEIVSAIDDESLPETQIESQIEASVSHPASKPTAELLQAEFSAEVEKKNENLQRANAVILVSLVWICGGSAILVFFLALRARLTRA